MIILRPARRDDKQAVSSLASQIWEGDDYVADCFDDWVGDPYGGFTVAYSEGILVGFGKLTRLTAREWWLEGLRVDPASRGQGIARMLHEEAVRTADRTGQGTLRFATSSKNSAVHRLARESGFDPVGDHLLVELPLTAGGDATGSPGRLIPTRAQETEALRAWLAASDHFVACGGLLEDGWQWFEIMPQLVSLIERGKVFWWMTDATGPYGGVVVLDRSDESGTLRFNYVDIPSADWPRFTAALCESAARNLARRIKGKPLALPGLAPVLGSAGWLVEEDVEMRVFTRYIRNQVEK